MSVEKDSAPMQGKAKRGGLRKITGSLITLFGLFWLAHRSNWIPVEHGHMAILWPLIMIGVGLFVLFSSRYRQTA
jgi:hypothetical protein